MLRHFSSLCLLNAEPWVILCVAPARMSNLWKKVLKEKKQEKKRMRREWWRSHTRTPSGWSLHRGWLWWCDRCRLHDLTTAAPNQPGRFHLWPHERCHPPVWTEKRVNIPQKTFTLKGGKVILWKTEFARPVFNPQIYLKHFLSKIKHFAFKRETIRQCSKTIFLVLFLCHCLLCLIELKNTIRKLCAGSREA